MELVMTISNRAKEVPPPKGKGYKSIQNSPCWLFAGCEDRYPEITFNGKRYLAHRVAYEASINELIRPNLVVRHKCDRPRCVNPAHLESGTALDNFNDTQKRKRNSAFGSRNGALRFPERLPRGFRTHGPKVDDEVAADIKQALASKRSPDRIDFISISAYFDTTPDQVEAIAVENDFVTVEPSGRGFEIPTLSLDHLTVPFPEFRYKQLSQSQVAEIRWRYFIARNCDRRRIKRHLRKQFKISKATLENILGRKTFKNVAPEIPVIKERGHGMAILSDAEVQSIRATWDAFPDLQKKGLASALERLFPVSHQSIDRIVAREQRESVPDDPSKALRLDEIPLKQLHQRGEAHHSCKLSDDDVREIRRLRAEENLTYQKIAERFNVTKENIGSIIRRQTRKDVK